MLGDTLLDFLHISASPALLFDIHGRLLYANKAAELCDGGDGSTLKQVEEAVFPSIPREVYTTRLRKAIEYRRPRLRRTTSNISASSSRRGQLSPSQERDNHDNEDDESGTPTGNDEKQRILWKITVCPCSRILALAQDSIEDPLPQLDDAAHTMIKSRPPNVRLDWTEQKRFGCLVNGGGEMGDRIRNFDWQNHPLGPIGYWPQARVEMVSMILASPVPMTAYLENESYVLYNDAYRPVLGQGKHPAVLGKTAKEVWGEIWEFIEVPLQNCLKGIPTWREDQLLFWDRLKEGPNPMEEVYATWYYVPYFSQDRVIGNLHMLFEQQNKQNPITMRRIAAISDLSAHLSNSRSTIDLCRNALEVLSRLDIDLPYCLAYTTVAYEPPEINTPTEGIVSASPDPYFSISSSGSVSSKDVEAQSNIHVFALQETVGCAFDSNIAPSRIMVDTDNLSNPASPENELPGTRTPGARPTVWQDAMAQMLTTGGIVEVDNVQDWLEGVPHRGLPGLTPYRAVLIPLKIGANIEACVICLLNPALPWGPEFRTFINIIARQFSLSLGMVKTFEQEVQRSEELAALDRAKTSFFTSISHELRTPLTLILGPIKDLTTDTTLSRAQASSISLVYRNARRLLRLVNSILDFARAEAGKLSSQFSPAPLGEITIELASSFRSAIESAGMQMIVENRVPEDTSIWVDIDKWEKIVFNLISNAFKFTTKGFIRVSCYADQYYFYLEVQDSGMGIPADQLSSVFERFVRVENSEARSIEGSGIGLSLTLELVKLHGGKMGVDSTFGQGSTFKLRIPLGSGHLPRQYLVNTNAPQSNLSARLDEYGLNRSDNISTFGPSSADTGTAGSQPTGSKSESATGTDDDSSLVSKRSELWPPLLFVGERERARILLADDNADLRTFIRSILGKYADITEAVNGQVAWELVQSQPFDLVLSDIMMPRMTGFQLLAAIRGSSKYKSIPVILLSARAGEDAGVESLSSGADDHLNKPFSSKELILRVHSHLQQAAFRSELETRVSERTAALEESKETFQRLSMLLQVGVHRSDRDGHIIWANQKWFAVLGLEYGNWDNWGERIFPEDLAHATAYYTQAVETGTGYMHPIEMRLLGSGDEIVDITYELQAERNAVGDCVGFVGVFSDVSILRKLERERVALEQSRREEAEANRTLQEHFIDVTAHELRNPLNAISNSAEMLGESLNRFSAHINANPQLQEVLQPFKLDMEDDIEAVETILLSARHQKRIADDVLHISKISGNLVQLVQNDWQPEVAVQNTLKMFNLEVLSKDITLTYERDPSFDQLGNTVIGDEGRFVQCFINLLSNALKFIEGGAIRRIRVRLGASPVLPEDTLGKLFEPDAFALDDLTPLCTPYAGPWHPQDVASTEALVHFSIMDTGPGMSAEEQGRIFKRYAQASPKTYKAFGGVGLGLWISRRLVELHGGAVSLQSTAGVGTIFRLYIKVQKQNTAILATEGETTPLAEVPPPKDPRVTAHLTSPMPQPVRKIENRKPRIMVVEDNELNLKILVKLLTIMQCETVTAGDGSESLVKLDTLQEKGAFPDLILMDLEMPVMDGLTATRHIRAREATHQYTSGRVPIVAVSANARQQYENMSMEAGMDSFIRKPYNKTQIAEVVKRFFIT